MTLAQLKYVITIADTGSMNEAAKLLFISQPSLSLALKELENEIGTELFKRSNRGVVLTPEGQEFLGYARQVTEQYKLMESRYIEKKNVKKKFGVSMQHYTGTVVDESQSRPLQDTAARKDEPGVVQSVFLLFHCYFCPSPAFFFSAYRRYPAVRPENFRPHIHPVPSPSLTLMADAWPLRAC